VHQEEGGEGEGEARYQLVMARAGQPGSDVNRSGLPAGIPIRLGDSYQRSGENPAVNVLDMASAECQAWVACLQRREQRFLSDITPSDFDSNCDQFFYSCPTKAQSLGHLVGE